MPQNRLMTLTLSWNSTAIPSISSSSYACISAAKMCCTAEERRGEERRGEERRGVSGLCGVVWGQNKLLEHLPRPLKGVHTWLKKWCKDSLARLMHSWSKLHQ